MSTAAGPKNLTFEINYQDIADVSIGIDNEI